MRKVYSKFDYISLIHQCSNFKDIAVEEESTSSKRTSSKTARYPAIPYIAPPLGHSNNSSHYHILVAEVERLCAIELQGLQSYFDTHLPNQAKPLETLRHILEQLPKSVSASCHKDALFVPEGSTARLNDQNDDAKKVDFLRQIAANLEDKLVQLTSEESTSISLDPSADIHTAHRICADELASLDNGLSTVLDGLNDINALMEAAENIQATLYDVRSSITSSSTKTGSTSATTPKKILRSMQRL